jgi:hypothetical protein
MKLQIDTQEKTIKIEEDINLGELIDKLTSMLPEWREYRLQHTTIVNWKDPIKIEKQKIHPYINPVNPYKSVTPFPPNSTIICGRNIEL